MKSKRLMLIIIIISLIIIGLVVIFNNIKRSNYHDAKYLGIMYQEEHDEYACLTFDTNGRYSLYDCDSEPTSYFFDDENECTYSYDNKDTIYFDCKYKSKQNKIKVVEWTKDVFRFEIDGKVKNFYAD
ncbi:MAG: hypothetical protein Q4E69_00945 [Bacilli bacterium]|nr:hypothetical protein [Bacilli bacterium]